MQRKTRVILALLLPVQYFGLLVLRHYPQFVETYYSQGVYPLMSSLSRYLFGWIPFSIGDLIYAALMILTCRWLFAHVKRLKSEPTAFMVDVVATLSVVYFTFHMIWGLNYLRQPLHHTMGLQTSYTTEQLVALTERLIDKSNTLHGALGYPDSLKIDLPYSQENIFELSREGYRELSQELPLFDYSGTSIKESLWSLGLTYMGYSGYYNPLTGESQVNNRIKNHKFPVVSAHEQAHQMGYAAENEANFIATLATLHHSDPYISYAGAIFSLRYCINEVARRDRAAYDRLLPTINTGILESYREMRLFWAHYKNPFEGLSKVFWDQFLKANNQEKGIQSYSYMVALLVNYYQDRPI
ncbi:MAG: DUF3810 domain-containing protein [Flavobacteriaceae bacterium]|mgnify:FL=1|nr:DUF3810 domain-containing protein [Flavobacteriaceae bacterium]MDG1962089.1 DUF3810 domain-containing protein [Flavobacteriaceae bacterium]